MRPTMNPIPVHKLTPLEADAELQQMLRSGPPAFPWAARESEAFRTRKVQLELWLILYPAPGLPVEESPLELPAPRRPHRRSIHLRRHRVFGVIA